MPKADKRMPRESFLNCDKSSFVNNSITSTVFERCCNYSTECHCASAVNYGYVKYSLLF